MMKELSESFTSQKFNGLHSSEPVDDHIQAKDAAYYVRQFYEMI